MSKEKPSKDHIWPTREGGPDEPYNWREITQPENSGKGAEMPDLEDVFDSSNPVRLAAEIDKHSVAKGFEHPRNVGKKGFGGLPRI